MKSGQFALVESVLGKLFRKSDEDVFGLLRAIVPQGGDGEHHAGEGREIVALGGGEAKQPDAFFPVCVGAGEVENPADGRRFEAEHVVFDPGGEVGVVERGVDGKGLPGIGAGLLAEVQGGDIALVDHEGIVGLHTADDGLDVESVGVFGIALKSCVGEPLGLRGAVIERLANVRVGSEALPVVETALVGKELDVDDVETVELSEEPRRCVGGWTHGVLRMGGHPLLELLVGGRKVEVIHVVITVIERGACEQRAEGRGEGAHRQKKEKQGQWNEVSGPGRVRA